jgi:hypothetical protein
MQWKINLSILKAIAFFVAFACTGASWAQSCINAPITTTPDGPTWEMSVQRGSSERANIIVWRKLCSEEEGYLVITIEPTSSSPPFMCSTQFAVVQDSQQYDSLVLVKGANDTSSFCGDLLVTTTFAVYFRTGQPQFSTFEPFTLFWDSEFSVDVGGYDPADYFDVGSQSKDLQGALSGSWYDPDRSGEGFVLEFASTSSGAVATAYWFTHREGQPYWLIGSTGYTPGDESITFDLLEVSGANFGPEFDPDDVQAENWGALSIEFDSCTSGFATWEKQDGSLSGEFELSRIAAGLANGVSCE